MWCKVLSRRMLNRAERGSLLASASARQALLMIQMEVVMWGPVLFNGLAIFSICKLN